MKKNLNRAHSVLVEHFTSDSRTRSGTVRPLKNVNSIVPHKILCRQIHTETFVKNPIKPLSKSVLQPAKTKAGLVNSRSFSTVDQSATENLFALPNAKDIPLFTQELAVSEYVSPSLLLLSACIFIYFPYFIPFSGTLLTSCYFFPSYSPFFPRQPPSQP